ncbi:MAG TPA: acyl-CoA dehydrogenase family protein [Nitrospiria bacterium]|nr:acyl-CoA dehydrogenase family protein [Nitrospiria bacterium]
MIDFELTSDQVLLRDTIRDFARREIEPGAARRDETGEFPHALIPKLAELKVFGLMVPEEYGGAGLGALDAAIVIEEIARIDGSLALIVASHNSLCSGHILQFGNDDQKKKYLTRLAKGDALGAWGLTEADSGSDAASLSTRARMEKDRWILTGRKMFITQGTTAGIYVIMARSGGEGKDGISAFILEKGMSGLSTGPPEKKMGVRSSDTASVIMEEVAIPKENLIGEVNDGYRQVLQVLDGGRIGIGAMSVGLGRAALEDSIRYAKTRKQFGKSIGEHEAIAFMIAEMGTEIEAARLLVHKAGFLKDNGLPYHLEASEAKLYASEAAVRAAHSGIQIHGGSGYLKDFPLERYYRDARLCEIGEGTSEIQRIVISREILK